MAGESFLAFSWDMKTRRIPTGRENFPQVGPVDWIFAPAFYVAYFAVCFAWSVLVAPLQ